VADSTGWLRARRSSVVLVGVSAVLLLILLILPPLAPSVADPTATQAWHGRITALLDPHRPDPSGAGFLPDARVLLLEGPQAGQEIEAYLEGPGGQQDTNAYRVGEDVVVTATGNPEGGTFLAVADRWRLPQLVALAGLFVLAVLVVGGWRGARALLGLALTIAVILKLLIPLLVIGVPPIPVAVVTATILTVLVIGLTEGFGRTAVAGILGTSGALALTALLAALATAFAGFTNTQGSELVALQLPNGQGLDLRGLLLAAFMIGSIGVLDDVTVTQAAAVDELARHGLRGRTLYAGAFNVGRSHIAATVNTLFLAYAGVSLPLLVYLLISNQPPALLVNGEPIAIEIVRTLVGSLGIVGAVPLTTVVAVWLASRSGVEAGADVSEPRSARRLGGILAGGLAAIAVVTLAASAVVGPLTDAGPRAPLPPDRFGALPSASTGPAGGSSASPGAEPEPSLDVPSFDVGDDIPLFDDNAAPVGTVRVTRVDPVASASGEGLAILVEFDYVATAPFTIDPKAWSAAASNGPVTAIDPRDPAQHPALAGSLRSGQRRTGWLEFDLPQAPTTLDLTFETLGTTVFSVRLF
jgi:uncharacterized membrane protein